MSTGKATQLRAELREVLERQMAQGDPPEVARAFERLRAAGVSERQVWAMLSAVLLTEMNAMARDGREFDRMRYAAGLAALPTLPAW